MVVIVIMNVINGERITYKQIKPNPLFNVWLEELYEEAKQKDSPLKFKIKEALFSLSKYPVLLQSGAECAILKGFDKKLCSFLDHRLELHNKTKSGCVNDLLLDPNLKPLVSYSDTDERVKRGSQILFEKFLTPKSTSPKAKIGRRYKPAFRCRSYGFLMALVDLDKGQSMSKNELQVAAQRYYKDDITKVWKIMTRLIATGLIKKSSKSKPQFSLTEKGYSVAQDLIKNIQSENIVEVLDDESDNAVLYKDDGFDEIIFVSDTKRDSENVVQDVEKFLCANKSSDIVTTVIFDKCDEPEITENVDLHTSVEDEVVNDCSNVIEMRPDSFELILLIDKNETSGVSKKNDPTVSEFKKYPELKHEYRSLKVGDFTWIARHKVNTDQELVLPYVVERKRMDDLGASIKDGRFHEQKFRLRKCGVNHVIYLVENHGSNKHVGLPMQSLMQALANTRVQDGFKVHVTDSLSHSVRFLATMTLRLIFEYKDKTLKGHCNEPSNNILMTFEYFNKSSIKNKPLSVTETFIKLLLQLKGVSVEKALTITNVYKTPRLLIEAYGKCDKKEGEMLLANLKFGDLIRSVGPTVSKTIYQLFTLEHFS